MKKYRRGFTLIELMIVVAIVAVLAAIALPQFQYYRYRSRTAETATLMGAIRAGQEMFLAEFDAYANVAAAAPPGVAGVQKRPWVATPCPGACDRFNTAVCTEFACIHFVPGADVHYSYVSPGTLVGASPEFAIGAAGDVDGNGAVGSYSYQSANAGGAFGLIPDGISTCPVGVPASQIFSCSPMDF